jgi:thiol-disulfide isomerase/thioredoxin
MRIVDRCLASATLHRLLFALVGWLAASTHAADPPAGALEVAVLDEELSISQYRADGNALILWVASGYGANDRIWTVIRELAEAGLEVWHVDLADSLFLDKNNTTMRELDGRYVAALISEAHARTGKTVTLVSEAYGALPVLRGARLWQLGHKESGGEDPYLTGAILFSPELYSEIPALGLPAVYDPIADATSIPLMLYQAGSRNNRWQLAELLERLRRGGAQVYAQILPGVTGVFFDGDEAPATLAAWRSITPKMVRAVSLLEKTATPLATPVLASARPAARTGLDTELRAFAGNPTPHPLELPDINGNLAEIHDFRDKVTVVNFWATWCPPCVEEIPSLNRLRQRMQGKAFELVSVNYAEAPQQVVDFTKRVDVHFPVLLDADGSVSAKWGALVFPSTFVIGPDGEIVYGVNGALHWDSDEVVAALDALLIARTIR